MKQAKHTPGPWAFTALSTFIVIHKDYDSDYLGYGCIGEISGLGNKDSEQQKANAQLIAAAPELLSALEMLLDRLAYHGSIDPVREVGPIEDASVAIAKAKCGVES